MSKDDNTWLNVGYVCFAVLMAYFGFKALELVGIQVGWEERYDWFSPAATLLGVIIGLLSTWMIRRDPERHDYLLASIAELRKVTWPSWPDTKRMTVIVCVVVGIFAVIVGIFDVLWTKALNLLIA